MNNPMDLMITLEGVVKKIKQADTRLDLSWELKGFDRNELREVFREIVKLGNLRRLDLSSNQLAALPESIGDLGNLEALNLFSNQLTALPESIGDLGKLRWLDLSSNQLAALPESIGDLGKLRWLDLSSNQLTKLPESIGKLLVNRLSVYLGQHPMQYVGSGRVKIGCTSHPVGYWLDNAQTIGKEHDYNQAEIDACIMYLQAIKGVVGKDA